MTKRIQNIRTTILRSLMVVAMIVCGVGESWATDYVISDGTNYLCNENGNIGSKTTFEESSCVWSYSEENGSMSNSSYQSTPYYLIYSKSGNSPAKISISTKLPSKGGAWTISDTGTLSCVSNGGNTYYLLYKNEWSYTSSSTEANAYVYSSYTIKIVGFSTATVNIDNALGSGFSNNSTAYIRGTSVAETNVHPSEIQGYDSEISISGNVITVTYTPRTDPTSLTVSPTSQTTYVGETFTITPTLSPSPCYTNITYSSADPTVASVDDNGVVTGNKIGTTTITVTAKKIDGTTTSDLTKTVSVTVKDKCATPTITASGLTCTFSCSHPESAVTFRYTIDGADPTSTTGTPGNSVTLSGYNHTIRVIATATGYDPSDVAELYVSEVPSGSGTEASPYLITNSSQLSKFSEWVSDGGTYASAYYKVTADITASSYTTPTTAFTGTFDGGLYTITGLGSALVGTASGATIKNVILDNVSISGSGNVGAIANEASGNARIYNCGVLATNSTFEFDKTYSSSSTVTSTNAAAGSIVGVISDNTRVLNCYSYADVSGSTYGAGIVGRCTGTWINTTTVQSTQCFVMNCMFYGNVSGNTRSPIVNATTNDNYSMYSYFRYKSLSSTTNLTQNGALAIQEDIWLKRFAFFQAAVTNHRDLAALYCFNDATRISEIAQWHIDETIAPWPILRKAESQQTTLNRTIPTTGNANEGNLITNAPADVTKRYNMNVGSGGYLTVNYTINDKTGSVSLPITDMDFEHYDYTWGKVVLPFINEIDGWTRDYSKACVGWEITGMTGGTTGTLTDYNYADRNCTVKDIYNSSTNPLLYAEGGNFIVPYGVTEININAHFAKAYYLSDASYDCTANGGTTRGSRPTTYHGYTIYNTAAAAWAAMSATTSPNDQAIVLVGNYHYTSNTSGNYTGKGCTVLSVDDDNDQQPDYGWYSSVGDYRQNWPSMRWTFVPIIGAGMTQSYSSKPPGLAIPRAKGWWEMTETTLCRTFEFESNDGARASTDDGHGNNCYIINGGWFQQIVRCFDSGTANRLSYMKVGGNAYVKEFFHGNHSGTTLTYTLRPIVVTGGEIVSCYMTGMGSKKEVVETDNNVRFYCAGGKINKYLSAYNGYPVVNATMKVDHAYINRFFGGGTTQIARLTGSIDVTMNYSDVTFFCGGPEFGDMNDGTTVTVNTTGSTFGEFYGAGYGGTALTRITNGDSQKTPFASTNAGGSRLNYNASAGGYEVSYEMENLLNGSGSALYRYYDYRAALSLATTGNVTTTATNCLFKNSFYGGGCQGKVNGTITSTLTDCDVTGSAFGGGYKAAATTISVYPTGGNTWPSWDGTYKAFGDAVYPTAGTFTWVQGTDGTYTDNTTTGTLEVSSSTVDMTTMGEVTGDIKITVQASADGAATVGGSVFGGGNESASLDDTEVKILGNTSVAGSVYGGGNMATVGGTTTVQIGDVCE